MRTVSKLFAGPDKTALNRIDRMPFSDPIILGDKDHIGFREFVEVLAFFQQVGVHHTAVVARPFSSGSFVSPLDFYIKLSSSAVGCQHIQTDGAVQQILYKNLCADIRLVQNDPQNQLNALGFPLETFCQEIIVQQAKTSEPL